MKLISTERGLLVVGEYLERDKTFIEHTQNLKRLAGPHSVRWAINKNERQPMIELAQHGIRCQPAENDQLAGIERVKSWLHTHQLWFVESRCPKTVQQMMTLRWAPPRSDGQSRHKALVYKRHDELPDGVRYALQTWPILPKPAETSTERDLSHTSPDMRASIERMRRIDKPVPDFWGGVGIADDFWL